MFSFRTGNSFLNILLSLLVIVVVLNILQLPALSFPILTIFDRTLTLYNIVIIALIIWLIQILPSPFREVLIVLLALWFISNFIFVFGFFSNIIVVLLILFVFFYFFGLF